MTNPSIVAIRSNLGNPTALPSNVHHLNVVVQKNGGMENLEDISLARKLLHRNDDVFTIITEQQTLVFKNNYYINGYNVEAKLTMLVSPDRNDPRSFISFFFNRRDVVNVTTGYLVSVLRKTVNDAVAHNLSFVNVGRFNTALPVNNVQRHTYLCSVCQKLGLHLFIDELRINVTAAA